jgi:hypothetical protein
MGLPTDCAAENRGPAFLRSAWISRSWLGAAVLVALTLWQQIVGWPLERRIDFGLAAPLQSDGEVFEVRLRLKTAPELWDEAFARVTEKDADLPRAAAISQLESAPGWYMKGRSIYLHPRDGAASARGEKGFTARLPWVMPPGDFGLFILVFAFWSGVLAYANNAVVRRILVRGGAGAGERKWPWLGLLLATGILLTAIGLRAMGFSFPEVYSDTKDYLRPALEFAAGARLSASPDRPFAYPLVLGLLLRCAPDFRAIVFLHSLATLLTGAIVGALLWLSGARLFRAAFLRGFARCAGLGALALFCLNETILQREWAILPEAWATIYMGLQLWFAWNIASRRHSKAALLARYFGLCSLGCLLLFTKPNWGLALGALPIPLAMAGALRTGTWRGFAVWTGAGVGILALTGIATMACQLQFTPGSAVGSLDQRSRVLICWHVPMVRLELERRLREAPDAPDYAVLAQVAQVLDEALTSAKSDGPGAYPTLGYDADRLFYIGMKKAELFQKMPRPERTALLNEVFWSALRRHPGMYVQKVLRQFGLLFARPYGPLTAGPHGPAIIDRSRVVDAFAFSENFAAHFPDYVPEPIRGRYAESLQRAKEVLAGPWPSRLRFGLSARVSLIYEFLKSPFVWTIFLPIGACAAAALWPRWRRAVDWTSLAPVLSAALWASASAALCALTSSLAQALEIQRYIDLFLPLTLFAQFIWPLLGLSVVAALARESWTPAAEGVNEKLVSGMASSLSPPLAPK